MLYVCKAFRPAWKKQHREGGFTAVTSGVEVLPATVLKKIWELQRFLGKKTMKEDYIAFMPKLDVETAMLNLAAASTHYNENHLHSTLGYSSWREYR
ncbi:transposase InsO family protein [Yokenella regensburgei]|nr:transposase InsO family protein [Yokenella regensburgei]